MSVWNIETLGAVPGGEINCAPVVQKAIDDCSAAGGGRVLIPAGRWLCGSIRLKSDVELHLENGARLICSLDPADISDFARDSDDDNQETGWDGGCFISAFHAKNVAITGLGTIDGQGCRVFFENNCDGGQQECPLTPKGLRPRMTLLEDVENLTVQDVTFEDSAFWTLHMAGCRHVRITNIRVLNNERGPNNDGIDPDACQDVTITGCIIRTADDAIVVKATKPMWEKYGDCENVTITGCLLASHDSALKIGTETWGDIRNVVFGDCVIQNCSRAVGVWVRDGGTIENILVHHLTGTVRRYADATDGWLCRWWGVGESVFVSATPRKNVDRFPGRIRRLRFDHLDLTAEAGIFLAGEDNCPITDVRITDCDFQMKKVGTQPGGLFDEQPSQRDVYEHSVPALYGRCVQGLVLREVNVTMGQPCGAPWGAPALLERCTKVQGMVEVTDLVDTTSC